MRPCPRGSFRHASRRLQGLHGAFVLGRRAGDRWLSPRRAWASRGTVREDDEVFSQTGHLLHLTPNVSTLPSYADLRVTFVCAPDARAAFVDRLENAGGADPYV